MKKDYSFQFLEQRAFALELEARAKREPEQLLKQYRQFVRKGYILLGLWIVGPLLVAATGFTLLCFHLGPWWLNFPSGLAGALMAGVFIWAVSFRIRRATGISVDRKAYPLLVKDIKEVRSQTKAPRFGRIHFSMDFNASVYSEPRVFGLLGSRHILDIGLPLLFCLTREEFKNILAHEIAHVWKKHTQGRRWGQRLDFSIQSIHRVLNKKYIRLFRPLYKRTTNDYLIRLRIYHSVVSRIDEREADRAGAEILGVDHYAKVLTKIAVAGQIHAEQFATSLADQVRQHNFPSVRYLEHLLKILDRYRNDPGFAHGLLRRALAEVTELEDTHPSLQERLASIGAPAPATVTLESGAADSYFGAARQSVVSGFDNIWLRVVRHGWRLQHEDARRKMQHYENELAKSRRSTKRSAFILRRLAFLSEDVYGIKSASQHYLDYYKASPDSCRAQFHYGRALAENQDPQCTEVLRRVMTGDPFYGHAAYDVAIRYFARRGEADRVREYMGYREHFYTSMQEAIDERRKFLLPDEFGCAHLSTQTTEEAYEILSGFHSVKYAYILQKKVHYFPDVPFYVVAVHFHRRKAWQKRNLVYALEDLIELPGSFLVVDLKQNTAVKQAVKRLGTQATQLYSHKDG